MYQKFDVNNLYKMFASLVGREHTCIYGTIPSDSVSSLRRVLFFPEKMALLLISKKGKV